MSMKKAREAKVATLERIPDSVFVRVLGPDQVAPVPAIERYYSDWSDIAIGMVADVETQPEPEPTQVSDPNEIRIYSVHPKTGKRSHLFTGDYTAELNDHCQAYADRTGERVELHNATDYRTFQPAEPPACEVPIGDAKPTGVSVYNSDTSLLVYEGEMPKDLDSRCERYADDNNVSLRADFVDDDGRQQSRFYVPREVKLQYARENARQWAERVGDALGVIAIAGVSWFAYLLGGMV